MVLDNNNVGVLLQFDEAISSNGVGYYMVIKNPNNVKTTESGVVLTYQKKAIIWEKSSYNSYEEIEDLVITNEDTVNHIVNIYVGDILVMVASLNSGEKAIYTNGVGFDIKNTNGETKVAAPDKTLKSITLSNQTYNIIPDNGYDLFNVDLTAGDVIINLPLSSMESAKNRLFYFSIVNINGSYGAGKLKIMTTEIFNNQLNNLVLDCNTDIKSAIVVTSGAGVWNVLNSETKSYVQYAIDYKQTEM